MAVKRRHLGRTGLEISEIGFGCGPTAGLMVRGSESGRLEAVRRALEAGINYFDTAPGYGASVSEANLGQTLSALGARPIVATKIGLSADELSDIPGAVARSVEASLARLRLEKLPLIQIHNRVGVTRAAKADIGGAALLSVDDILGPNGVVAAFKTLRQRGLVQFFGCSAYGGDMACVENLIDSAAFDAVIVNYSMANPSAWRRPTGNPGLRDYGAIGTRAASSGLGAIALRVLEGGVLTEGGERTQSNIPEQQALQTEASRLRPILSHTGESLSQAALRFALSNTDVSTVLVGISNKGQVDEAVRAAEKGPLPKAVLAAIAGTG